MGVCVWVFVCKCVGVPHMGVGVGVGACVWVWHVGTLEILKAQRALREALGLPFAAFTSEVEHGSIVCAQFGGMHVCTACVQPALCRAMGSRCWRFC